MGGMTSVAGDESKCEACDRPIEQGYRWCAGSKRCRDVIYSRDRRQTVSNPHWERTPTAKGVLALDGEGFDGNYTLLAASDGSYVERYEPGGLSTEECFTFLLGLPPKPLKWGFAFTYDVNMILRDLSLSDLERLRSTSRVYYYNYSIHHYPGKMFRVVDRTNKHSVTIWDLYPFIQSSFVKFLTKFELAEPEVIERIAAMKDQRSDFANVDRDEIRNYCIDECTYLAKGVHHFLQLFEEMNYRTNAYYSPGTIAALEFRKRRPHDYYREPPATVQRLSDDGYYGGRAEISKVGPILGQHWQYDINSAYPYAATLLPCLAHGEWKPTKKTVHPHGIYRIQFATVDETVWGPFPWRPSSGSLKYPTSGVTTVWGVELIPWLSTNVDIQILQGWVWRSRCDHRPFRYLQELYDERAELKQVGDGREYVLKLILNSTYGKLAQRRITVNGKVSRWQALAWAGMITATTRAMLASILRDYQEHVIMVATDSILSDVELPLPIGSNLGEWSVKELRDLFVVGAGFLFAGHGADRLVRTRGLRSQDIQYSNLETAWRLYGREGTYPATINRFFGYGLSLQRVEGYKLWRKFWQVPLTKRFSQFPRRRWQTENVWDGRTFAPTLLDARGTELLDGFNALTRDSMMPTDDQSLARLLISLASRHQLDDATSQPDWVITEMGG